ncbi:immunoglobulin-binding protein 1 [Pholidichthys leucotaenia]
MAELVNNEDGRQPSNSGAEPLRLSEMLDRGWKIYEEVDSTNEPLGSNEIQVRVSRGIQMLEEASRMVAQLELFSRNEELEEISTADLKFLLLPALIGGLKMKQSGHGRRLETVRAARGYFVDFLQRCKDYNVIDFQLPGSTAESTSDEASPNGQLQSRSSPCPSGLVAMAAQRQAKIERYRQKKELESRLSDVRRAVESGQADDDITRDFYLLNVRRWITVSLEEVESIDQEMVILRNMDAVREHPPKVPNQAVRQPIKPFILTKDAVQAQVFGVGYPSLPTMTVDDWYEQHRKHGVLPDQGIPRKVAGEEDTEAQEREETEKEEKAEKDDEEALLKARNWDDWKDTHRRGYGNRQNMG